MTPAPATPLRLFFALWPDDGVRAALARWSVAIQRVTGGRATRPESIHQTLAFLGATDPGRLAELAAAVQGVRVRPFELLLDTAGFWKHNRLAWAGADRIPPELDALVTELHAALAAARFAFDHKPFALHLTLVRKARWVDALPPVEPVRWRVEGFVLVRSILQPAGSEYAIEQRWP